MVGKVGRSGTHLSLYLDAKGRQRQGDKMTCDVCFFEAKGRG